MTCEDCGIEYPPPEPRLYSFNSPLGACPQCEGFGNIISVNMELVVPDANKSLAAGAIAPWNTPAYAHELEELLALAADYDVPVDMPFSQLSQGQRDVVLHGVPQREFGGLDGFFAWLERRKYKMHVRVFLSRWRSSRPCPACGGSRLRPEALAARIGGRNIAEICAMQVREAARFFRGLELSAWERRVARVMLEQVQSRLSYLEAAGLDYLALDRTLRTLSGGEARRVALTAALGSSLVNMLYVLDEPSIGLHPRDVQRLVNAVRRLQRRANTVVVVEHEEGMIRAADEVIEIGPGAGERGGRVVFQGTPQEMERSPDSLTGEYLSGRRGALAPGSRRPPNHGSIRLAGARGNNLQGVTVEFPLGLLCLVTGVSGSGKSTLVQDTLYPALCRRLRKDAPKPCPVDDVYGDGQIDDVVMVDQSPIGRSPRSNPVTYLKAFDEIRAVFADTVEARTRNYDAGHFSFNVDGGRCAACRGDGCVQIDMQFLANVYMKCGQCGGARYRDEILNVTYRGRNIAEVLEMTVREAFTFFRGQPKVQARLKRLINVGLDYVRLGQPANTLSGGEAQRLKLAAYMSAAKRGRCLFLLDEPTTGLHFSDVVQLLDCFDALLAVGHSLIVVEHNLQMMTAADYIIDLGPGAAEEGGRVVAKGTPEMVARDRRLRHRGLFGEGPAGAAEGGVGLGFAPSGEAFSGFFAAGLPFAFSAFAALSARGRAGRICIRYFSRKRCCNSSPGRLRRQSCSSGAEPLEELRQLLVETRQGRTGPLPAGQLLLRRLADPGGDDGPLLDGGFFRPLRPCLRRQPVAQLGQVPRAHHSQRGRGEELPSLTHPRVDRPLPRFRLHFRKLPPLLLRQGLRESRLVLLCVMLHPVEQRLAVLGVGCSGRRVGLLAADFFDLRDPLSRLEFLQPDAATARQPSEPLAVMRQRLAKLFAVRLAEQLLVETADLLLLLGRQRLELPLAEEELVFLRGAHVLDSLAPLARRFDRLVARLALLGEDLLRNQPPEEVEAVDLPILVEVFQERQVLEQLAVGVGQDRGDGEKARRGGRQHPHGNKQPTPPPAPRGVGGDAPGVFGGGRRHHFQRRVREILPRRRRVQLIEQFPRPVELLQAVAHAGIVGEHLLDAAAGAGASNSPSRSATSCSCKSASSGFWGSDMACPTAAAVGPGKNTAPTPRAASSRARDNSDFTASIDNSIVVATSA